MIFAFFMLGLTLSLISTTQSSVFEGGAGVFHSPAELGLNLAAAVVVFPSLGFTHFASYVCFGFKREIVQMKSYEIGFSCIG